MSTMEALIQEVKHAPDAMLEEVLDFVRFLKSGRFAPSTVQDNTLITDEIEVVFETPRTISDLANEQRAFLATLAPPLVHIDLPGEEIGEKKHLPRMQGEKTCNGIA